MPILYVLLLPIHHLDITPTVQKGLVHRHSELFILAWSMVALIRRLTLLSVSVGLVQKLKPV